MWNDRLVTQLDMMGSNKVLSFPTINYYEVNEQCQEERSEILLIIFKTILNLLFTWIGQDEDGKELSLFWFKEHF